ncbi:hypothetical protein ACFSCW_00055 [Sphingomonas tabacisoli]|uniref:Uncharacterized protein n=1 Tax=Sphingomonas tabacisoli TaxID=2249466 RepID=A0ABW4HX41_9SPHN
MTNPDDLARTRFFILSLLRLSGAVLVMFGLVIAAGRFESIPKVAGTAMVLIGALDFALVPRLLARRWRTPK